MPHPSRPSTRRFQTTAALSDTAVWVCFLASLLRSATCRLLACATVWICLFVLVLPSRPLPSGARFCPSCGLLPRPPKFEMECKPPTTPNTRCLNYLFYTPRNRGVHLPEKRENPDQFARHFEALCCVQQLIGNRDHGPDIWWYGAHSPAPDTPANTP